MHSFARRKDESASQFRTFSAWLKASERNTEAFSKEYGIGLKQTRNWAEKFDWENRAADYDEYTSNKSKIIIASTSSVPENSEPLTVEEVLQKILDALLEKIELSLTEIQGMDLLELSKFISALLKTLPEIENLYTRITELHKKNNPEADSEGFEKIIRSDDEALHLAHKLLERISEIQGNP
ncbi:MAG: hypothetical protein HW421_755 [Ignavibacteria bacterium]|nr:hypothetical protein [Ignavibacteria bacterium]